MLPMKNLSVLFSRDQIAHRVGELGSEITRARFLRAAAIRTITDRRRGLVDLRTYWVVCHYSLVLRAQC